MFQTTNQGHGWKNVWMDVNGVCWWSQLFFGKHQICCSTSRGFPVLKTFTLWYAFNTYSPFWRNHEILKPRSTHSYLPSPSLPVLPKAKPRRGEVNNTSTDLGFGLTKNPPHMRTSNIINFYGVYWIIEYVNNWWSFYDGSDLILMFACCHWPHSAMPSACVRDLQAASLRDPRQPPTEASPGQPFQLLIAYKDTHWMPQSVEHENPANSANLYMLHLPLVAHLPFFTCSNMASLLARCWLGVGHIASQKRILLIQNDCIDVHCPTHRISSWEWVISLEVNPCKSACSSAVVERNVVHNIAQSNMGIHGEVKSSKAGDK